MVEFDGNVDVDMLLMGTGARFFFTKRFVGDGTGQARVSRVTCGLECYASDKQLRISLHYDYPNLMSSASPRSFNCFKTICCMDVKKVGRGAVRVVSGQKYQGRRDSIHCTDE